MWFDPVWRDQLMGAQGHADQAKNQRRGQGFQRPTQTALQATGQATQGS